MQSPSNRKHQQHSIAQLADFAAHMVCYLLYGHQPSRKSHNHCVGTPPSSIPSSPLPNHSTQSCPCDVCSRTGSYSPARSTPVGASYTCSQPQPQQPPNRPTHRRIQSESDIVQPKPMFRKFCLDVLSATLLSPSVVLLSLKYIQQLMINLKESNKIVNTGEGAEYRFFTGALILANKFLDDNTFTNKTWADITGMKIKDVNHLEMQFLNGIDFRLFTSSGHYSEWLANLTQFTGTYMPSQHQVAYQQQAAAAQSPISPMDQNSLPAESSSMSARQQGSGLCQTSASSALTMTSISQYIDSVKQIQQKSGSNARYHRMPSTSSYGHQSQSSVSVAHPSQTQYMSLPPPPSSGSRSSGSYSGQSAHYTSSPTTMSGGYQQGATETVHRKRSANIAFEDAMDRSPCYDMGSVPHSTQIPASVQTHKRFSSCSSAASLMGMGSGHDLRGGHSPMLQQQPQRQRPHQLSAFSHRASSGSLSSAFRSHQRSASGSHYMDMVGSSFYNQEPSHAAMPLSNSHSRPVHPFDRDQEHGLRPSSRSDVSYPTGLHPFQHGPNGGRSHSYRPTTPPHYSPMKCEASCQSMGCGSNAGNSNGAYDVDPRLWGPLDNLSLYAITTQAAKRVMAQGKALSSSTTGLHMYYPTTLA
ncbi:MAG: cyclin-domain-containing protein [Benniella sp.]|nr:MAG: cyclin-domain-containing protein [Benniella sp.]